MSRFKQQSRLDMMEGVKALVRGEDSEDADLGALLVVEALLSLIGRG